MDEKKVISAIERYDYMSLTSLLQNCNNINYQDENGYSFLIFTIDLFHKSNLYQRNKLRYVIDILIYNNININLVDNNGWNALFHLLLNDNECKSSKIYRIAVKLIQNGIDLKHSVVDHDIVYYFEPKSKMIKYGVHILELIQVYHC